MTVVHACLDYALSHLVIHAVTSKQQQVIHAVTRKKPPKIQKRSDLLHSCRIMLIRTSYTSQSI